MLISSRFEVCVCVYVYVHKIKERVYSWPFRVEYLSFLNMRGHAGLLCSSWCQLCGAAGEVSYALAASSQRSIDWLSPFSLSSPLPPCTDKGDVRVTLTHQLVDRVFFCALNRTSRSAQVFLHLLLLLGLV